MCECKYYDGSTKTCAKASPDIAVGCGGEQAFCDHIDGSFNTVMTKYEYSQDDPLYSDECYITISEATDLCQSLLEADILAEPYELLLGELSTVLTYLDQGLYLFGVSARNVEPLFISYQTGSPEAARNAALVHEIEEAYAIKRPEPYRRVIDTEMDTDKEEDFYNG